MNFDPGIYNPEILELVERSSEPLPREYVFALAETRAILMNEGRINGL